MAIKINSLKERLANKVAIEEFAAHTIAIYELKKEEDDKVINKLEVLELIGFAKGVKDDFIIDLETFIDHIEEFNITPYFKAFLKRCLKENIDLLLLVVR